MPGQRLTVTKTLTSYDLQQTHLLDVLTHGLLFPPPAAPEREEVEKGLHTQIHKSKLWKKKIAHTALELARF